MSIPDANCPGDSALPSFFYGRRTKPLASVEALYAAFLPASSPFTLARSTYYRFPPMPDEAGLILLEEGIASLCHAENNMVISTIFSPSLFGLIDGYGVFDGIPEKHHCSLFAETNLQGRWIAHQAAAEILSKQNLWQEMAHILAQRLMVLSMRSQEMVGVDSYLMVRTLLMELADYPEAYRQQINVLSFIQRRTNLSRSRIMSILSELRKGDYILIHRGVLKTIAHPLPAHF
ncbi:helix-turn-helix domain-containing protein [Klebsiella africana]|uniref:winged helix-turn-helix transcriptional regulator n=1 Tax=Klebsiella africana TaxID=2489010 RepID=UPI00350F2A73